MAKERLLFEIEDQSDSQPIVDTHYYKWLLANNITDLNYLKTKLVYLAEQGFEVGVSKISSEDLTRLKHIESHYCHVSRNLADNN